VQPEEQKIYAPPAVISATAGGNNRYKFTGKERDSESGLDNFGARYDSSTLGRFMSPDPDNDGASEGVPQSWNAYSYALNNPLNVLDPDGRDTVYVVCGTERGSGCAKITEEQFEALKKSGNFLFDSKKGAIYAKNADGSQGELLAGYYSYKNRAEQANAFATDLFKSMALNYAFGAGELGIGRLFGLGGTAFRIATYDVEVTAANGTRITGFTEHGWSRAAGEGAAGTPGVRAGVKQEAILDALKNPTKIISGLDKEGRPFETFVGKDAKVVVNPESGKIVSVNPTSRAGGLTR
jgi:RHS repeat-associated protein